MEKIKLRLYQFTLFSAFTSLALTLVSSGRQREFFYFAIYASILGLFFEREKIHLKQYSIALPVLLLGMLNVIWYMAYEFQYAGLDFYNLYLMASKKILLGCILIFYLDNFKNYISTINFYRYFLIAAGIGTILASAYAIGQAISGLGRAEMGGDRATLSAYIFSVLSLSFIYSLYLQNKFSACIIAGAMIVLSWVVILLTGTRSAMGLFLFISVIMTLHHFRKIHIKSAFIFFVSVLIIAFIGYSSYIKPKINQTLTEIHSFQQGKDNTSLGSRFSMWSVGVLNGDNHPLGQSMESRERWTAEYVKQHHEFSASMNFIDVHLHNEFIERYSLQGIPGVLLLAFLFLALIIHACRNKNTILLMTTISLLLYGLTDVILLSSEGVIFFLIMFSLSTFCFGHKATANK